MNPQAEKAEGTAAHASAATAGGGEPRFLIATCEGVSRCAKCRAYRRATLEGLNFSVYWCGRCAARLVLTRLDREGRPAGSSTHRVTRHERDARLHLFETENGPLVVFLRPVTSRP